MGTAGFGFSSTLISEAPASPDTVLYTERMTSGRLSVVTGLLETNEATISEVIRISSSLESTDLSDVSDITSTQPPPTARDKAATARRKQPVYQSLLRD